MYMRKGLGCCKIFDSPLRYWSFSIGTCLWCKKKKWGANYTAMGKNVQLRLMWSFCSSTKINQVSIFQNFSLRKTSFPLFVSDDSLLSYGRGIPSSTCTNCFLLTYYTYRFSTKPVSEPVQSQCSILNQFLAFWQSKRKLVPEWPLASGPGDWIIATNKIH